MGFWAWLERKTFACWRWERGNAAVTSAAAPSLEVPQQQKPHPGTMNFFPRALNASSACSSDLPCEADNDYCYKYLCLVQGVCSTAPCKCSADSDCTGSKSGVSTTSYCLSGTCSTLSSGGLAGIILAALAVFAAIAYYVFVVKKRAPGAYQQMPQQPQSYQQGYPGPQGYQTQGYQAQGYQAQGGAPAQGYPAQQPYTAPPPATWQ